MLIVTYKENKTHYLLVLLLLMMSGNPVVNFSEYVRIYFVVVFVILFGYAFVKHTHIVGQYAIYITPFLVIYFGQFLFTEFHIDGAIYNLIRMFVGVAIFLIVGKSFIPIYFQIIYVVCLISLFGFVYNNIFGAIPGISMTDISQSIIVYNQHIGLGGELVGQRNAGMFWEPGAFQGYANMALLFIIPYHDFIINNKTKILTIVIAVMTTYSTTGYVVLFIIAMIYIMGYMQKTESYKFLLSVLLMVVFVTAYLQLDFMHEKIVNNVSSIDAADRLSDYTRLRPMIIDNIGCGATLSNIDQRRLYVGLSNGFITQLLFYGIFGTLYYYLMIYVKYRKQVRPFFVFSFCVTLIILFQGEGFITYPLFLGLPFLLYPAVK